MNYRREFGSGFFDKLPQQQQLLCLDKLSVCASCVQAVEVHPACQITSIERSEIASCFSHIFDQCFDLLSKDVENLQDRLASKRKSVSICADGLNGFAKFWLSENSFGVS